MRRQPRVVGHIGYVAWQAEDDPLRATLNAFADNQRQSANRSEHSSTGTDLKGRGSAHLSRLSAADAAPAGVSWLRLRSSLTHVRFV